MFSVTLAPVFNIFIYTFLHSVLHLKNYAVSETSGKNSPNE